MKQVEAGLQPLKRALANKRARHLRCSRAPGLLADVVDRHPSLACELPFGQQRHLAPRERRVVTHRCANADFCHHQHCNLRRATAQPPQGWSQPRFAACDPRDASSREASLSERRQTVLLANAEVLGTSRVENMSPEPDPSKSNYKCLEGRQGNTGCAEKRMADPGCVARSRNSVEHGW
jgi:hypothetical protein